MILKRVFLPIILMILFGASAQAELRIEITEHSESAMPLAVVPFAQQVRNLDDGTRLDLVISSDLERSGWFELAKPQEMLSFPKTSAEIDYRDWRLIGSEALVIGEVTEQSLGVFEVYFELYDVASEKRLIGNRFTGVGRNQLRELAHHIADLIYFELTGVKGIFSTRIAYVTKENGRFQLHVADVDGHNPVTILQSSEPILSPAWSSDGQYLAYVSYTQGKSAIYRQHLRTGKRDIVVSHAGINGAPAWSPDGTSMAMTLSKDGNPEIYIYRFADRALRRLTNHFSIDTEPVWVGNGSAVLFTSDRSGVPQLFRVSVSGGQPERLTFEGNYNARPTLSPDGKTVALVHGRKGQGYVIAAMDLDSGRLDLLTDGQLDESPSFSPNGQTIIYTTTVDRDEFLQTVSVDGRVRQKLALNHAKVRESAWSPFKQ